MDRPSVPGEEKELKLFRGLPRRSSIFTSGEESSDETGLIFHASRDKSVERAYWLSRGTY